MTKKTLAKKFMTVYRMYRFKKFGEPFTLEQTTWSVHDEIEDYGAMPEFPSPMKDINN